MPDQKTLICIFIFTAVLTLAFVPGMSSVREAPAIRNPTLGQGEGNAAVVSPAIASPTSAQVDVKDVAILKR